MLQKNSYINKNESNRGNVLNSDILSGGFCCFRRVGTDWAPLWESGAPRGSVRVVLSLQQQYLDNCCCMIDTTPLWFTVRWFLCVCFGLEVECGHMTRSLRDKNTVNIIASCPIISEKRSERLHAARDALPHWELFNRDAQKTTLCRHRPAEMFHMKKAQLNNCQAAGCFPLLTLHNQELELSGTAAACGNKVFFLQAMLTRSQLVCLMRVDVVCTEAAVTNDNNAVIVTQPPTTRMSVGFKSELFIKVMWSAAASSYNIQYVFIRRLKVNMNLCSVCSYSRWIN